MLDSDDPCNSGVGDGELRKQLLDPMKCTHMRREQQAFKRLLRGYKCTYRSLVSSSLTLMLMEPDLIRSQLDCFGNIVDEMRSFESVIARSKSRDDIHDLADRLLDTEKVTCSPLCRISSGLSNSPSQGVNGRAGW